MTGGLCPAGYTCPTGTIAPIPCEKGTYQPNSGETTCLPCPPGRYCDEFAIDRLVIELKKCKAGYLCIEGATIPAPMDGVTGIICSPGHYCPEGTSEMLTCTDGTYEPREGSSKCQDCIAGYYCPSGSIRPLECPNGYYCPLSSLAPVVCPNGRFGHTTKLESSDQCAYCPAGKYCQNGIIMGSCSEGYYCD